ncbi:MAG: hypothetical protein QF415_07510 [Candidatus Undinarchaeales archaeon]|jgi:predicted amidohydrolase|nr:hypothetical protein [Candidatus Undinarchaeales archaeon]MDP7492311.1 hypothetical protein [Candidatus Undinarchaeales archaeon]
MSAYDLDIGGPEERPRTIRVGLIQKETSSKDFGLPEKGPYDTHGVSVYEGIIERALDADVDVLVAPEYFFLPGRPLSPKEKDELVSGMAARTKGKDLLLLPGTYVWQDKEHVHNTLPIIHDGKVVRDYGKMFDGGEADIALAYGREFASGSEDGAFTYKGLDMGVEICADHYQEHAWGAVRNPGCLQAEVDDEGLDLQLVVSSGITIHDQALAVREGGYAVLCDGYVPMVQVYRYAPDDDGLLTTHRVEPVEVRGQLHIYELEIGA